MARIPVTLHIQPCILGEFAQFPLVTGVTDATLCTAPPGRDGRAGCGRDVAPARRPRAGLAGGLGELHGPVEWSAPADRPRLRPRSRDVAVRRPGRGDPGTRLRPDRGL